LTNSNSTFIPVLTCFPARPGAGKSILVDALGLLTGAKASAEAIRTGESRAIVEAVFETDRGTDLERLGLDADDEVDHPP
jgi:DNA repair protein RecN (Recombination protein N)